MAVATDFLLDEAGDLLIENGDFVFGESDMQHIQLILALEPGELKESPLTGVGIKKQINGSFDGAVRREIKLQLEADGYSTTNLVITPENITIDATRNS
ncbi:hypothetical protein [Limnovirga soli]|uniref:Uncharacterized protein n=1 Tax=Limnovirga soli TaxID=2656915 RepID=A0A8J8FAS9_9BACT|nr:hypothetical protein [Limnovirga soli]NNV54521.1 hypothetical protein [Limnovirga soli]